MGRQLTTPERNERRQLREDGLKRCPQCDQVKTFAAFNKNRVRYDGLRSICRGCQREEDREYRKRNPDRHAEWQRRNRYGLRPGAYAELREEQGCRCAACGDPLEGGRLEHLDHDHATGEVRGILCIGCNLALGYLKDDPARIQSLAAYLAADD